MPPDPPRMECLRHPGAPHFKILDPPLLYAHVHIHNYWSFMVRNAPKEIRLLIDVCFLILTNANVFQPGTCGFFFSRVVHSSKCTQWQCMSVHNNMKLGSWPIHVRSYVGLTSYTQHCRVQHVANRWLYQGTRDVRLGDIVWVAGVTLQDLD